MSIHIHSDYYHDTLETRYCLDCQKRFAVGEELAKSVTTILCPYCGSSRNEAVAWWEDEDDELGCAGISFRKADDHLEVDITPIAALRAVRVSRDQIEIDFNISAKEFIDGISFINENLNVSIES